MFLYVRRSMSDYVRLLYIYLLYKVNTIHRIPVTLTLDVTTREGRYYIKYNNVCFVVESYEEYLKTLSILAYNKIQWYLIHLQVCPPKVQYLKVSGKAFDAYEDFPWLTESFDLHLVIDENLGVSVSLGHNVIHWSWDLWNDTLVQLHNTFRKLVQP